MTKPTCSRCWWFFEGHCRRYPPVIIAFQHYEREVRQVTHTYEAEHYAAIKPVWPQVLDDDWCGDYKEQEASK